MPFAHYWMHNGYINVDNRKMSKSLNNFFTVREVAKEFGYEPIRYLMVASHYRSPINYSTELLKQCAAALERLYTCRENLEFVIGNAQPGRGEEDEEIWKRLEHYQDRFCNAMDDDLNTADGIAVLFDLAKDINTNLNTATNPHREIAEEALKLFDSLAEVLGLLYAKKGAQGGDLDQEIESLIQQRVEARKNKNWAEADRIRDELNARHVVLEDTPQGTKWHIEE